MSRVRVTQCLELLSGPSCGGCLPPSPADLCPAPPLPPRALLGPLAIFPSLQAWVLQPVPVPSASPWGAAGPGIQQGCLRGPSDHFLLTSPVRTTETRPGRCLDGREGGGLGEGIFQAVGMSATVKGACQCLETWLLSCLAATGSKDLRQAPWSCSLPALGSRP